MKDFYTIDDLRSASAGDIFHRDEKPARLAVIGDPIRHSKSPQLHQPALDALGINASYIRVQLTGKEFNEGVDLLQKLEFIGCNITLPHKERALHWANNPDVFAQQVGVANTIKFSDNSCYTTDPVGLERAVLEYFQYPLDKGRIFITGAGGGAGSATAQYVATKDISHMFLYNRTPEKLDDTYERIINACSVDLTKVSCFGGTNFPAADELELLINATSLGLNVSDPSPIPESLLRPDHVVYDMTYGCENELSKACKRVGAKYVDGLSMLRHQGAEAFKLWFPQQTKEIEVISYMGL